jgi:hypothetical protein
MTIRRYFAPERCQYPCHILGRTTLTWNDNQFILLRPHSEQPQLIIMI